MKPKLFRAAGVLACISLLSMQPLEADWPNWRGPNATGVAPDRALPITWRATEHVAWKAPIAGAGVSTPIVSGDHVYVTSQIGAGVRRGGPHPARPDDPCRLPRDPSPAQTDDCKSERRDVVGELTGWTATSRA